MDNTITQPIEFSTPLTTLDSNIGSLSVPNQEYVASNDHPSNSSPKAPNSEKLASTTDSNSPSKSVKVQAIVESIVGDSSRDQSETNEKIHEIDSYINKLLEKLKVERQKITEMESARASLKSMVAATDKERHQEQENLEPVEAPKESTEATTKAAVSSPSQKATPRETGRVGEKGKKAILNSIDPFKNQKLSLNEILNISTQKMNFGVGMPGKIVEETLDITNKTNEDIVVQIFVDCLNAEFKDSEEYIYSIRRSHLYDYNDKHYLIMSPYSAASFKITLKVPNVRCESKILGEVKIAVRGAKGMSKVALTSSVTVPKVICPKELFHNDQQCNIIKLAIKQGKKQESKFPLKNLSNVPVSLDLNFYTPKNVEEDTNFQCLINPGVVNIPPNGTVFVNIALKNTKALGRLPENELRTLKKVLVGSARNSALMYTFLLEIDVC